MLIILQGRLSDKKNLASNYFKIHPKQSLLLAIFLSNPYFKIAVVVLYVLEIEKRYRRCSFDSHLMRNSHFDNKMS